MHILTTIVERKKQVLEEIKQTVPLNILKSMPNYSRVCRPFLTNQKAQIIAEFKRRSPSKGDIAHDKNIADVVNSYSQFASALSVLTDLSFFGGGIEDLVYARSLTSLPVLRKDFIFDEYQIYEAKAFGADAILLIAAILDRNSLLTFFELATSLGLHVLFEIHHEDEVEKLPHGARYIGVNNRDLNTMLVKMDTSLRLYPLLKDKFREAILICESGVNIKNAESIRMFNGFLVAESLITSALIDDTIEELKEALSD